MIDIQELNEGFYKTKINKVGVRNIIMPIKVKRKDGSVCPTIATISVYCSLDESKKGVHMSRYASSLFEIADEVIDLKKLLLDLKEKQKAENAYIKFRFPYFYKTETPIKKILSYESVNVELEGVIEENVFRKYIEVETTEIAVCPCSKNMSLLINNLNDQEKQFWNEIKSKAPSTFIEKFENAGFGAHNQKSRIKVKIEEKEGNFVWIEDIVDIIEKSVSCPTFSVLKREDEKWVTEVSYMGSFVNNNKELEKLENGGAKFVEDISRDLVKHLNEWLDVKINDYSVVVTNDESIHSSSIEAVSIISANRNLK